PGARPRPGGGRRRLGPGGLPGLPRAVPAADAEGAPRRRRGFLGRAVDGALSRGQATPLRVVTARGPAATLSPDHDEHPPSPAHAMALSLSIDLTDAAFADLRALVDAARTAGVSDRVSLVLEETTLIVTADDTTERVEVVDAPAGEHGPREGTHGT